MAQTREEILETIQNLLTNTTDRGCSEAEAIAAAKAVTRLMLKHNISEQEISDVASKAGQAVQDDPVGTDTVDFFKIHQGSWKWQYSLSKFIAETMGCQSFFSEPLRGYSGFIKFVGTQTNVRVCIFMFKYLVQQFEILATTGRAQAYKDQMERYGNFTIGKNWLGSFCVGISDRVGQRIMADFNQAVKELGGRSAMLAIYDATEAFVRDKMTIKIVAAEKLTPSARNEMSYRQGVRAGDKVNLGAPTGSPELADKN